MNDEAPREFPVYQGLRATAVRVASPAHAQPLLKLMARALQNRRGKSVFDRMRKRKKPRIV